VSTKAHDKVVQNVNLTNVLAEALCLNISEKQTLACLICLIFIFRNGLPPQSPVRSDNTRVTRFALPSHRITTHTRVHCDLYRHIANDPWNCSSKLSRSENNLTIHFTRNSRCPLALFEQGTVMPILRLPTYTKYWASPESPWSTSHLLKLRFTQLVNKLPAFYGIQWFITVFKIACYWTASISKAISLRTISILFSK
jgi:hypothetical protein